MNKSILNEFDFGYNIDLEFNYNEKANDAEKSVTKTKKINRRKTEVLEISTKHEYRRAFSELQLLNSLKDKPLEYGKTYNFITGGDVDALSYLQLVLRQQNIKHLLFSTWCMAAEDILYFDKWFTEGKILKCDAYVGEIFPGTYRVEYNLIKEVWSKHNVGRVCVFKNHSKIFAGDGEAYPFGIQTSANINTNPRTENGSITICKEIYEFYKEYFDGINSFN